EISVLPEHVLLDPSKVEVSLYAHLALIGKAPVRALQHIRALNAEAELADQLGVPCGRAVLFITRVGYLASGMPVELTHSYCRSDHYGFVAEMRRDA
ncbi:MAG TPA: GntR family transcriptional regulator, partial [Methylibium sp.]